MGFGTLNPYRPQYTGAEVSSLFMKRWRSRDYIGAAKPWGRVSIRRGYMHHRMHNGWPGSNAPDTVKTANPPPFGRIIGLPMYPQWYPDWTPTTDWVQLQGAADIELAQTVSYAGAAGGDGSGGAGGSNGMCVATITADNVAWVATAGALGSYHSKQRGWLWPWRGFVPTNRPGGKASDQNEWYDTLPNAQILVEQGYGSDTAVKTFTGLIDTIGPGSLRPDRITLTARDFGSTLVDVNPFYWNKDPRIRDPMYFIPPHYPNVAALAKRGSHNWVIVNDATDIVRCVLRWVGFKEWDVQDSGVQLKTAFLVDRSSTWIDVVNQVAAQLGYVFFIAEPTTDDLSIGVPVFRKQSVLRQHPPRPITLNSQMLTDIQPQHDNTNDRHVIRVRGRFATRKQGGRPIIGGDMTTDGETMFTYTYFPPWKRNMSGILKQLTYYNQGSNGVLGFDSQWECQVAALLVAVQIALGRDTATVQCPANPAIGLDAFAMISDATASGIASRLYVTGRRSSMTLDGGGTSSASSGDLIWSHEFSGSLCDNPEWDQIISDYNKSLQNKLVVSHGGPEQ